MSLAFFDKGYEASFGIVQRAWFETRLRAHFHHAKSDEDAAWYALRNIIYASGCRIELSAQSTFSWASQMSWAYFENALSVHTDVVFLPSSTLGVQALVLMVCTFLHGGMLY